MDSIISPETAIIKAFNFLKLENNIEARKYFNLAYNSDNPDIKNKALINLLYLDLKEGKYAKVRKVLEELGSIDNLELIRIYGLLELIEYNYTASNLYFNQCLKEPNMQFKTLLSLAKNYVQMGDFELANHIYETLLVQPNISHDAIFGLVGIKMLQYDYDGALTILKRANKKFLPSNLKKRYDITYEYLLSLAGKPLKPKRKYNENDEYMFYRLYNDSEETLLNHISKHLNQEDRCSNGCFFKYIDLQKLLNDAKDIIDKINYNHHGTINNYLIKLDTPIGYKEDVITSDLCITTVTGTKSIITMYPVNLSDKFDNEGMLYNEELKLKRNLGVNK